MGGDGLKAECPTPGSNGSHKMAKVYSLSLESLIEVAQLQIIINAFDVLYL